MASRAGAKGGGAMRRAGGLADADVSPASSAGIDRGERAAARRRDAATAAEYRQGRDAAKRRVQETRRVRGHAAPQVHEPGSHEQAMYEAGFGDELADQRRDRRRAITSSGPAQRVKSTVDDGAGILLGFVAYALFLAYVKGGWSGVRGWLAAKFLNRTGGSTTPHQQPGPYGQPPLPNPNHLPNPPAGPSPGGI